MKLNEIEGQNAELARLQKNLQRALASLKKIAEMENGSDELENGNKFVVCRGLAEDALRDQGIAWKKVR